MSKVSVAEKRAILAPIIQGYYERLNARTPEEINESKRIILAPIIQRYKMRVRKSKESRLKKEVRNVKS